MTFMNENIDPQLAELLKELDDTSDRVCAIACCAFVEQRLEEMLTVAMPGLNHKLREKLFDGSGLLGPLIARADIACGLKLITSQEHHDIKLFASIRNAFAHRVATGSFTEAAIAKKIGNLHLHPFNALLFNAKEWDKLKESLARQPRKTFEIIALRLVVELGERLKQMRSG